MALQYSVVSVSSSDPANVNHEAEGLVYITFKVFDSATPNTVLYQATRTYRMDPNKSDQANLNEGVREEIEQEIRRVRRVRTIIQTLTASIGQPQSVT